MNKNITQQDIDSVDVKLKPLFGIEPKYYVAAIYAFLLAAAIFFVLFYPGLSRKGVTYSFVVDPPGAAIYVDNVYKGYAPCKIFIPDGKHNITIKNLGFQDQTSAINVNGRVFATIIFKPTETLSAKLEPSKVAQALEYGVKKYASWSISGTTSEAYQIPMVLSEAAKAVSRVPEAINIKNFAGAAFSYASQAVSMRDAMLATTILYGKSAALTPVSMANIVAELSEELLQDKSIIVAFASLMEPEVRSKIEKSALYIKAAETQKSNTYTNAEPTYINAKKFIPFLNTSKVIDFYIAASETTIAEYKKFINDNPEWSLAAKAKLIEKGLVDDNYLSNFDTAADNDILTFVSYEAASAYCKWLSSKAKDNSGWTYELPSDKAWSEAAFASGASALLASALLSPETKGPKPTNTLIADRAGFYGLLGNVWEWCNDSFASYPEAGVQGRKVFAANEALVRGGSWANNASLVNLDSRGAVNKDKCSPYTGFRIALVRSN